MQLSMLYYYIKIKAWYNYQMTCVWYLHFPETGDVSLQKNTMLFIQYIQKRIYKEQAHFPTAKHKFHMIWRRHIHTEFWLEVYAENLTSATPQIQNSCFDTNYKRTCQNRGTSPFKKLCLYKFKPLLFLYAT